MRTILSPFPDYLILVGDEWTLFELEIKTKKAKLVLLLY